jgi:hypothetical protein
MNRQKDGSAPPLPFGSSPCPSPGPASPPPAAPPRSRTGGHAPRAARFSRDSPAGRRHFICLSPRASPRGARGPSGCPWPREPYNVEQSEAWRAGARRPGRREPGSGHGEGARFRAWRRAVTGRGGVGRKRARQSEFGVRRAGRREPGCRDEEWAVRARGAAELLQRSGLFCDILNFS